VEKMRTEAANAFLKLLEEPPPNTIFILTAPSPEQVLPTIQSRCQSTFFPALEENTIADYLIDFHQTDANTAHKAAFLAQGNLNEAVRLKDEDTHIFDEIAQNWLRACYAVKMSDMQSITENISKLSRETQKNFLVYLLHILRNAMVAYYEVEKLLFVPDTMKDFVSKLGKSLTPQAFEELYSTINQAMEYVSRNINSKILYLTLSVRISIIFNKSKKAKAG
jgi:DNA polymerase-3 subunit delta'